MNQDWLMTRKAVSQEAADAALAQLVPIAEQGGFHIYLVGGSVRDRLMGGKVKDLDLVVVHPSLGLQAPKALADLAKEKLGAHGGALTNQGTIVVRIGDVELDFAAPRAETYAEDSRKPTVEAAGIAEDARRRDFTINALYEDLHNPSPNLEERVVDPTGHGLEDLKNKVLRSPNPEQTFLEDPLRMMRAIRFKNKTGFELDPETDKALQDALPRFKESLGSQKLSWERVRMELEKLLSESKNPGEAMRYMAQLGILQSIAPEWESMVGAKHDTPHHLEDIDDHSYRVLDEVAKLEGSNLVQKLAAWLHDIAKPQTKKHVAEKMHSVFHNHDLEGVPLARAILERLHFPNDIIDQVAKLVENHLTPHRHSGSPKISDKAIRRFVRDMGDQLQDVLNLSEADMLGRTPEKGEEQIEKGRQDYSAYRERIKQIQEAQPAGPSLSEMKPLLDGNELQQMFQRPPGKWIGDAQKYLIDLQLGDPAMTKEQAAEAIKAWLAGGEKDLTQVAPENPQQGNDEVPPQKTASRRGHGVVSAHLPGLTDEQNAARMEQLKAKVTALGYKFEVMDGSWRGVPERSLLIKDVPEDIMQGLAAEFSQEAIVAGGNLVPVQASMRRFAIGTSGFGYDTWRERFYPRGLHQRDRIAHYARHFQAVEITSTRHSNPTTRVLMNWAAAVPDDFVFAVCAPIGVRPSNCNVADRMRGFMRRMSALGKKLGPIALFIDAEQDYQPGDAKRFFDKLPAHKYAVQVESPAWMNQEVLDELIARNIAVIDTQFGAAATDIIGWSYKRLPPQAIPYMSKLAMGPNSLVFVEDKSKGFPSKELLEALKNLGLDLGPVGLTAPPHLGPSDPTTGPNNSALPSGSYDDERGQPLSVVPATERDDELDYFGKKQPLAPPAQYPDLDANDGSSDPLTGIVDGDTRKL